MDFTEQTEALSHWRCTPRRIEPLRGGTLNEHWCVEPEGQGDALVLRRYSPANVPAGARFEHDALWHLWKTGWPVAPPIPAADGNDVVTTESGRWSMFASLPGTPAPVDETVFLQRKGAVLALVQRDLGKWEAPVGRPGFGRVTDLQVPLRRNGFEDFEDLATWWDESDPKRAAAMRTVRSRNLEALERGGYRDLADETVYGGCFGENVLFQGKDVTGLLAFDSTHRDARVADLALSLLADCGIDADRVSRMLAGYAMFCDPPLTMAEADLVPDLMLANALRNAAVLMSGVARGGPEWMRESVHNDVDVLLPRLERSLGTLRRITRAAAGMTRNG